MRHLLLPRTLYTGCSTPPAAVPPVSVESWGPCATRNTAATVANSYRAALRLTVDTSAEVGDVGRQA